jgi:hypothetical protein
VELPDDFYSTDFYTDKLISYLQNNKKDGKPFFAYAAYTAPHWPLQAPGIIWINTKGDSIRATTACAWRASSG